MLLRLQRPDEEKDGTNIENLGYSFTICYLVDKSHANLDKVSSVSSIMKPSRCLGLPKNNAFSASTARAPFAYKMPRSPVKL
jgi:hypothetical protein